MKFWNRCVALLFGGTLWAQGVATDSSPHTEQFITADESVRLEVLDWGGSGRPLVLLTGLGDTAHVFDTFAPKLIAGHHVYGITRRGFGASSAPASGYTADRLGDDALAVIDALKLERPVLVGHSVGGEELSSIGSRYPEKVAGLVYLDAGYTYAFYDRSRGDMLMDLIDLQKKLEQLTPGKAPLDPRANIQALLETDLPAFERDLRQVQKEMGAGPPPSNTPTIRPRQLPPPAQAIMMGAQKYTDIRVPVLAIYAFQPFDEENAAVQAKAFETGIPGARVIRLSGAAHYVFRSNEAEVLREIEAFLNGLREDGGASQSQSDKTIDLANWDCPSPLDPEVAVGSDAARSRPRWTVYSKLFLRPSRV